MDSTIQREKIALVGGGMAGLVAAYELSRTPELRARYEVTVYQLGWRLGGKLASGRDPTQSMRNTEHGLHVWFGFYDNAFAVFRELFDRWQRPEGCPWTRWQDAFTAQQLTPVGETIDGKLGHWDVEWPLNADVPGSGGVLLTPWGALTEMFNLLMELIRDHLSPGQPVRAQSYSVGRVPQSIEAKFVEAVPEAVPLVASNGLLESAGAGIERTLGEVVHWIERWLQALGSRLESLDDLHFHGIIHLLQRIERVVVELLGDRDDVDAHHLRNIVDIGVAFLCGLLNPAYQIFRTGDLDNINHLEFRQWLIENGGSPAIVHGWSAIDAVYDAFFQYRQGDQTLPDYEAGTAARVFLRTVFTYKGAVLYLVNAGMGETVIGPMYEVLRAQGVRFEFFHKLKNVGLAPNTTRISELVFERQAITRGEYRPTFTHAGLVCWPSEPFWDQLEDGAALEAADVDFESHWCQHRGPSVILRRGVDFDRVISAVDLGSFKPLNAVDGSMFAEVLAASPRLARLADALPMIPSMADQLWMGPTPTQLGWTLGRATMVTWAYPQDVWADMSAVLSTEDWQGPDAPQSLFYFTGVWGEPTTLFARPWTASDTPALALADVVARTDAQFDQYVATIWPNAVGAHGGFDRGLVRSRYTRANVSPAECCVGSPTDTAKLRPRAHESGVEGLVLAGNWVRNGLNSTCVEQATMTGMAAARAVIGEPLEIVGEYFLARHADRPFIPPTPPPEPRKPPTPPLPAYVSSVGHGEQVMLPPGQFKKARIYAFTVPADRDQLTSFARRYLSDPTGGALEYTAVVPYVFCTYLHTDFMTSTAQQVGTSSDSECGLWIMLVEKPRGLALPRIVFWMPYVIIDNSIGMATGREAWGFRKEIGPITMPTAAEDPARFVAQATIFRTLQTNTRGHVEPLIRVERDAPLGPLESAWENIEDIGLYFAEKLLGGVADWASVIRRHTGITGWLPSFDPSIHAVNLKQFRDAAQPTQACYQSVVSSPLQITKIHGAGPLLGDYRLRISRCESHQIVGDLGLPGEETPAAFGAWLEVDMLALAGTELWRAKT